MNKLRNSSLLLLILPAFLTPVAVAETPEDIDATDNRIEKYEERTQPENGSLSPLETLRSDIEAMESEEDATEADTRAGQKLEEYQAKEITPDDYYLYNVRRSEAFELVRSAYRGDFEEQGINSYAVFVSNYQTGELTAEDVINAAIQAGELSPGAMEDESYVDAVESQLRTLSNS
ncbi:MAG: hypothetical protein Tsb0014_25650 [Pleurocapsa sp.]